MRECHVRVWCSSQMVVEGSRGVSVSCFRGGYDELEGQLQRVLEDGNGEKKEGGKKEGGGGKWWNPWWDVYDFTPGKEKNYHVIVDDTDVLKKFNLDRYPDVKGWSCTRTDAVPYTLSPMCEEGDRISVVVWNGDDVDTDGVKVVQTSSGVVDDAFLKKVEKEVQKEAKKYKTWVAVELAGRDDKWLQKIKVKGFSYSLITDDTSFLYKRKETI